MADRLARSHRDRPSLYFSESSSLGDVPETVRALLDGLPRAAGHLRADIGAVTSAWARRALSPDAASTATLRLQRLSDRSADAREPGDLLVQVLGGLALQKVLARRKPRNDGGLALLDELADMLLKRYSTLLGGE